MAEMYYYNGVLLPEIPADDVIKKYPYLMIQRYNYDKSVKLYGCTNKPYMYAGQQVSNTTDWIKVPEGGYCRYDCPAGGSEWTFAGEGTSETNLNQFNFKILWANFDVPNGSADSNVIYFPATKAYRAVDVFTPDTVAISRERMTGFADQARRLGKVSGELTPGQIEDVLRGVTVSAALPSIHPLLIAVDCNPTILPKFAVNDINIVVDASLDVFAKAEDTTPPPPPKYSYNGVVLPEIPADVLADYPYAFIRDNNQSGHYDLFLSSTAFYLSDSDTITGAANKPWWRIEKAKADTAQSWEYYKESTKGLGVSEDRTVLWSNHDIPNGSADATEIYFEGSEPVLAE